MNLERRIVLRTLAQFAMVALPLGRRGLMASGGGEIQAQLAQTTLLKVAPDDRG